MKTRFLLLSAFVIAFSSCQNMRYGHVPKVRAKKQVTMAHKKTAKKSINYTPFIEVKKPEIKHAESNLEITQPNRIILTSIITTLPLDEKSVEKIAQPSKKHETTIRFSPRQVKKIFKEEKQKAQQEIKAPHSWLWYIIVGLIFLLLAAILEHFLFSHAVYPQDLK